MEPTTGETLEIALNGAARRVAGGTTVAELLVELGRNPRHLAVEINEQLVPRGQHAGRRLADGDRVEVVTLVGGG